MERVCTFFQLVELFQRRELFRFLILVTLTPILLFVIFIPLFVGFVLIISIFFLIFLVYFTRLFFYNLTSFMFFLICFLFILFSVIPVRSQTSTFTGSWGRWLDVLTILQVLLVHGRPVIIVTVCAG